MSDVSPLEQLNAVGQSVWLDTFSRDMLDSGELEQLVENRGVVGVTTNPSIFRSALSESTAYDNDIAAFIEKGLDDAEIFTTLSTDDVRRACDLMAPIYRQSGGTDGMVSIELEPDLAHDIEGSIARAQELSKRIDRPNVMIKVPATTAGITILEELVVAGIHVNVTLLFSVGRYREIMDAYITAMERRRDAGDHPNVRSVASFFISRIDTEVDDQLEEVEPDNPDIRGKAAVANALMAWDAYLTRFTHERFTSLQSWGALPQRPLWASTSTKNPSYSDLAYVEPLIAAGTVNTMPLATLNAFHDHGTAEVTITPEAVTRARACMGEIRECGIDIVDVTDKLLEMGLASFAEAYDSLIEGIGAKRESFAAH